MDNRRNFYRILHVQPDAPMEIIRMSYLTLMQRLKMHPDLGGDHANAVVINEAFATLIDPTKRASYDRTLARDIVTGQRGSSKTRGRPDAPPAAASELNTCAFCGTPCPHREWNGPESECSFCQSPLYPAAGHELDSSRRTISRIPRELPIQFYLAWPQRTAFVGRTEDVSINGMRFVSDLDMVPNERVKIDCLFCCAVAVVRHSNADRVKRTSMWRVGVEFLTLRVKPARGVFVSTQA